MIIPALLTIIGLVLVVKFSQFALTACEYYFLGRKKIYKKYKDR